jgi:predicted ABC-class ATPase
MPDRPRLEALLRRIDGRPYPAYRDLRGPWRLGEVEIALDHVQGDPFAAPSRLRLLAPTGLDADTCADPDRRVAAEDWLLRRFGHGLRGERRGSGKSGELWVYRPGPEILARSAVRLHADGTAEVRLQAGLPAQGRRILGRQAAALLTEDLPRAALRLRPGRHADHLEAHIASVCCQRALRRQLRERGLVAFVADGAVLPRASGVARDPLEDAVPFSSPPELRVRLDGPHGPIEGMGLPEGITLIVGGGFHGKSTLLQALQWGHLDHLPGDGRERVVCDPDAVKVKAEEGRRVQRVDISAFLRELPGGRGTAPFSTEDASGSTSQAAAIAEAIESGARVLLLDEDSSATNLLVRDARMRQLIAPDKEPITPLVERVRQLHTERGVSLVMVVGGVGDYLAVADTVIAMEDWRPRLVTARAHALAGPAPQPPGPLPATAPRRLEPSSLAPTGRGRVRARSDRGVSYGGEEVDLLAVEQVLDAAHAASLGHALRLLSELTGPTPVSQALDALDAIIADEGPDALSPHREPVGDLILPRRHEVAAALNRLRTLRVLSGGGITPAPRAP